MEAKAPFAEVKLKKEAANHWNLEGEAETEALYVEAGAEKIHFQHLCFQGWSLLLWWPAKEHWDLFSSRSTHFQQIFIIFLLSASRERSMIHDHYQKHANLISLFQISWILLLPNEIILLMINIFVLISLMTRYLTKIHSRKAAPF